MCGYGRRTGDSSRTRRVCAEIRTHVLEDDDEVEEEENLVALNLIPSSKQLHEEWKAKIVEDFAKFGLEVPTSEFMQKGSRKGIHTEYFGYILCELQYMQRTYPNCVW